MTPEEFAIARRKLGLDDDKLAAELQVSPKVIRAWSDGTLRIPTNDARRITWHAAAAERQTAIAASGLPECDWVKAWEAEPLPQGNKNLLAHFQKVERHADECPVCQDRERFIRERFGPMPEFPQYGLAAGFAGWQRFIGRFPEWTHPVFNGAAIVTALAAFRVLLALPRGASWAILIAIPGAAAFGAIGGLAYSALRPYIASGGMQKSMAHILVLLAYATAAFAVFDIAGSITGDVHFNGIGVGSFVVVAALVIFLWRRAASRT